MKWLKIKFSNTVYLLLSYTFLALFAFSAKAGFISFFCKIYSASFSNMQKFHNSLTLLLLSPPSLLHPLTTNIPII